MKWKHFHKFFFYKSSGSEMHLKVKSSDIFSAISVQS